MRFMLLFPLLLTGCSIAHPVTLPDGRHGYVIAHCKDLSYCYNRAAKLCGGKYEVIDRSQQSTILETKEQISVHCLPP